MSVSISMIVRNSADVLERCLESVKDADEIVIIDTGSDDSTKEIARKYTSKVYDYYGCNEPKTKDGLFMDFADARNKALEYCTKRNILTIDADEVLQEGVMDRLKTFQGTSMSIRCVSSRTGEEHRQPRLYMNTPHIYWKGAAHNYLTCHHGEHSDITITYGGNSQRKRDPNRTLRILERWVRKYPRDCTRELYYLGKEYHKRGNYKKALSNYKRYLKRSTFIAEKADAYLQVARCYAAIDKHKDAINANLAALNLNPDNAEVLRLAGDLNGTINRAKFHHLASKATNSGVLFIRPDNRLRVTMLSDWDWAGSGLRTCQSIRNSSKGDVDIEAFVMNSGQGSRYFSQPTGAPIEAVGMDIVQDRINRSDIVHYKSDEPFSREFFGLTIPDHVKIVRTVSGSAFRSRLKNIAAEDIKAMYEADLCSYMTKDLEVEGWIYAPQPYEVFDYSWKRGNKFIVSHVPSDPVKKGSQLVKYAMSMLNRDDVKFIYADNVTHQESLKIKSKSHLYIDQMILPPVANAAYEAMAMGVPVITWTDGTDDLPIGVPFQTAEALATRINRKLNWDMLQEESIRQYKGCQQRCGYMGERWLRAYEILLK